MLDPSTAPRMMTARRMKNEHHHGCLLCHLVLFAGDSSSSTVDKSRVNEAGYEGGGVASFVPILDVVFTGSGGVGIKELGVHSRSDDESLGDWRLSDLVIVVDG